MNEVRLIYFGSVTEISASLLFMLNIVDVRPESESQKGFFLFETRFGQESFRPLSLDVTDTSAKDVLIYRYLSEREKLSLQDHSHSRRFFVLLHNFLNLDYICSEINSQDHNQFNFLVDLSNHDFFKPFAYASRQLPSKSFYRIAKVNKSEKAEAVSVSRWNLPLFFLLILKFLINPVDEVKRLAVIAKHSNLRVVSRLLELMSFLNFVLRVVVLHTFRMLGLRLFYRSNFVAGAVKVISIKGAYFFRHIVLMSGYKLFGVAVDVVNCLVRVKDAFVTTLYYKFLHKLFFMYVHGPYFKYIHRLYFKYIHGLYFRYIHKFYFKYIHSFYYRTVHFVYHQYLKKAASYVVYKVIMTGFFQAVPIYDSVRLQAIHLVRYRIVHYIKMGCFKTYGLFYDLATFVHRFTKLVLLYPFFKMYWFISFQFKKRLVNRILMVAGVIKVISIRGVYFFRHIVLMLGYKLFGAAVDTLNFLVRVRNTLVTIIYYRFLHKLFFKYVHDPYFKYIHGLYFKYILRLYFMFKHVALMAGFKIFGVLVDGSNLLIRGRDLIITTVYYKFLHQIYFKFIHGLPFKIRHIVLMSWFKILGFVVDGVNLVVRVRDGIVVVVYYKFLHRIYFKFIHGLSLAIKHVIIMSWFKLLGFAVDGVNLIVRVKDMVVTAVYYGFFHRIYFKFIHGLSFAIKHVILMSWFKLLGFAVDGVNLIVRVKDMVVTAVYYGFFHRLYFKSVHYIYHQYIKKFATFVIYKLVLGGYFWLLPKFHSLRLQTYLLIRYRVPHYCTMSYYKTYGLLYDAATFSHRFTKLVLLYPFRKTYWFARFQYEKRLKKFLV